MPNKKSSSKEKKREYRIYQEIIVDCYDEIEQMLGWQCYLKDTLEFPFVAKCIKKRNTSPPDIGETVTVIDIDTSEDYGNNIFVNVKWQGHKIAVPLAQLEPAKSYAKTRQAIEDWRYWSQQF